MERIDDSQVYIILFPTGLLLMVSINPLTITSKIQLNLKKDEQILDYKYSISQNGHNHCIWLLDQKMQVWKCSNERNPNQATWTLNRVAVYTHLTFKSFFNQATTYEDFFMTCSLSKLKCFKDANIHEHKIINFQVYFNATATKSLVIQQPRIYVSQLEEEYQGSAINYIEKKLNASYLLIS